MLLRSHFGSKSLGQCPLSLHVSQWPGFQWFKHKVDSQISLVQNVTGFPQECQGHKIMMPSWIIKVVQRCNRFCIISTHLVAAGLAIGGPESVQRRYRPKAICFRLDRGVIWWHLSLKCLFPHAKAEYPLAYRVAPSCQLSLVYLDCFGLDNGENQYIHIKKID